VNWVLGIPEWFGTSTTGAVIPLEIVSQDDQQRPAFARALISSVAEVVALHAFNDGQ
jgi:hypothetical protein